MNIITLNTIKNILIKTFGISLLGLIFFITYSTVSRVEAGYNIRVKRGTTYSNRCCGCGRSNSKVCRADGRSTKCFTTNCSGSSGCKCEDSSGTSNPPQGIPKTKTSGGSSKKCDSSYWRPCNEGDKVNDPTLTCGWAYQISGCGVKRRCYLGDCCTATKPVEAKNMIITTNRENSFSRDNITQRQVFSWFGRSFGKGCPKNENKIAIQFFDNTNNKVIGGTGWTTEDTITDVPTIRPNNKYINLLNTIYRGYICTNDVKWRVVKTNGSQKSYSDFEAFSIKDVEPEITSFKSSAEEYDDKADTGSNVTFNIRAEGPYINSIEVGVIEYDLNYNLINDYKTIGIKNCNKTGICNYNLNWLTPTTTDRIYKVEASAYNYCGESKNTIEYYLTVKDRYTIIVNSYMLNDIVEPNESTNCSLQKSPEDSGTITISSKNENYIESKELSGSNQVIFDFVPESSFPIYVTANKDDKDCRNYNLYCLDNSDLASFEPIQLPDSQRISLDITFAEQKKDSWATFFDGNIYANNVNINSGCEQEIVGGNFVPTTLTKGQDNIGGSVYTSESIISDFENIIRPDDVGSLIENLDEYNVDTKSSNDIWINKFVFPREENLPNYIRIIDNISDINNENKIYYVAGDLNIDDSTIYSTDDLIIVYVNGNLNINNNIVSNNENGFITFIVKDSININNDFGINDYFNIDIYNTETDPNIEAGLISLDENTGIEFIGTDDYKNNPDIPLILRGFLISKGYVNINRDLGIDNPIYPAVVIKSNNNFISKFKELSSNLSTGIEIFDITWEYTQ